MWKNRSASTIVFIITGLDTGGAEIMLLKILENIDRHKFSPHVISLTNVGEIGDRIRTLGVPVEALGMLSSAPNPMALWRLVRRLKVIRPVMTHTMMYHANLIGGLATWLAGLSALSWGIHHSNLTRRANKSATLATVWVCAKLSHWLPKSIVTCSEVARQVHLQHGYCAQKMVVLPNGFDMFRFRPDEKSYIDLRLELGLSINTPLVGLMGRFDVQKNHSGFFEAARLLHQRLDRVHFVLAGKGVVPENADLMQLIDSSGVSGVTHLLGIRHDMPRLMAALDVLASSSIGEAFPNVLGEAMSCGVPCVTTDVGDAAYIVGDTGQVVCSGDMAGLADAVERLLRLSLQASEVLGERARARVAKYFEIGAVTRKYEKFFLNSTL